MARDDDDDGSAGTYDRLDVEEPLLPTKYHAVERPARRTPWYKRTVTKVLVTAAAVLAVVWIVLASLMHRLALHAIAGTEMAIDRMELLHPRHDRVDMTIAMRVVSSSPFTALVDGTSYAIQYDGHRVGAFAAPSMTIAHGTNHQLFENVTLIVHNRSAWDAFAKAMIQEESTASVIKASLNVHVHLLAGIIRLSASDVAMTKNMTIEGMRGLRQMKILDVRMTNSTQTTVITDITTCLHNPSVMTIHPVGKICMHAYHPNVSRDTLVVELASEQDVAITRARMDPSDPQCAAQGDKKTMAYGYNLLQLKGTMVAKYSDAINDLISKYLGRVDAELTVVSCSPSATSVELFNPAMQGLVIPTKLPAREEPLVGRMFFESIRLDEPQRGKENSEIGLATGVVVETSSPLGPHSALDLTQIQMKVGLYADVGASYKQGSRQIGELLTTNVDIINGHLVETSNISVNAVARLVFPDSGQLFGSFVRESMRNSSVKMQVKGTLDVLAHGALGNIHLKDLPMDVTSCMRGMRNFDNVTVESFSLPGTGSAEHGETMSTHIALWNPSLFTVAIGDMEFGLQLPHGETFGQLSGVMNMAPGLNALEMSGKLQPIKDSHGAVSSGVSQFFSAYLQGKSSALAVTISRIQFDTCIWMKHALVGMEIQTTFPGVDRGFNMISNIQIRELDVVMREVSPGREFESELSNTDMAVRTDMSAEVLMPTSIKIPIDISNLSVALLLENARNKSMGMLRSGVERCEYNQTAGGAFRLNMNHSYSMIFAEHDQVEAMSGFVQDLLTQSGSVILRLTLDGRQPDQGAFPMVETRMGTLALKHIPVDGTPMIPGMHGFRDPPVKILRVDIVKGSQEKMLLTMEFEISNPSSVRTSLGTLKFGVVSNGHLMGTASIADFSLECCGKKTVLRGSFEFAPHKEDMAAASIFLSNFVSGYFTDGKPQEISIRGSKESTPLDILQPALSSLTIPSMLPTLADLFPKTPTLVTSSLLYPPSLLHLTRVATALELRNPFREDITVTDVDLHLYPCRDQQKEGENLVCKEYYKEELARFHPQAFENIFIPSQTAGCFSCCQGAGCEHKMKLCPRGKAGSCMNADVSTLLSPEAIAAIFHTATSGLLMKVNGTIGASIGAYPTRMFYRQEGLIVHMARLL
ncbi:TPA: hypothetical protein N0F65_012678 [Lagenidium giganteum]|uniref:AsmA-like C-terminal domain-containing protein n=1 Tax=Lagenidium giganteum TaxID=4803 RepID=A0AAV2YKV4_9STRA|nr:TPA: hypothetical protein N0F65_012678 [Lagenidium giganteum]